jgi:hypothetical protein
VSSLATEGASKHWIFACDVHWSDVELAADVCFRTRGQKLPDNVGVRDAASDMQRRLAHVANGVGVGASLKEKLHTFDVFAPTHHVERRIAIAATTRYLNDCTLQDLWEEHIGCAVKDFFEASCHLDDT